jgi:hypothetical protein
VERIWQDFRGTGRFQCLALDCWNGSAASVQSFVDATGITYPILRLAGYLQGQPPAGYALPYDNYVLVDAAGIVRYTSAGEPYTVLGRFNDSTLRAAIRTYLPTGVEARTWSGMKGLFR